MAARANSLTARATKPTANAGSWSAPAKDLRVWMSGFRRLGYDVDTLLASVGLRGADLDDPDAVVPCETYGAILGRAQQERYTPNLALELARLTPIGAYPLLDYLVLTSNTAGE